MGYSKIIKRENIPADLVYTTYFCHACGAYEIKPFTRQNIGCKFCGNPNSQVTTNVTAGVSDKQLNEIYNLMDVYCHPFTSGGQEIPIQEAKLAELITLVTNYSCGEDSCTIESGGMSLDWSEYREPELSSLKLQLAHKASIKDLLKFSSCIPTKRLGLGKLPESGQ